MPRRSRGCKQCRQRRIGCDGGLPSCRQCLNTKRACSGPLQGALIIDQTESVSSRASAPQQHQYRPRHGSVVHQPSSQSMFAHVFIAEFVSFITARDGQVWQRSWLSELQHGTVVDEGPALELSMQATALAYCGAASKNPAAVRHACQIYGRALSKHARSISQHPDSLRAASLCTCIMLSFFEAVCSTSFTAYGAHLRAAQSMLAMMPEDPPGPSQSQVVWQLAKHIQCQTLFVMVVNPEDYLSKTPDPKPWAQTLRLPKNDGGSEQLFDHLMEILRHLADHLARRSCGIEQMTLDASLDQEVAGLWDEFRDGAPEAGEPGMASGNHYHDGLMAMTVAYFAAARVMLGVLGFGGHEARRSLHEACGRILTCAYSIEGKNIGCAYLRMFFALTLVALYGSDDEQRGAAAALVGRWLQNTAFYGMGSVAIRRIHVLDDTNAPSVTA